ncbi:PKD domain-containing protein [Amycolatopsis mongoliensis]|uniref:PKD domain-containing protein n=1 Tax=Amycolatopsis mongoliensis TaxID=715475 RepID=A0A9Y2JYP2_9PSEU|nr:PKD domain-containing protein [Amycolatopsis sp. 4-36]WIY06593.1 PKD domain-containing protein [Amycolatopsis sp. 4-36]
MKHSAFRRLLVAGLAVAAALVAPATAYAEAPSNDDFATATTVTALPFKATQDVGEATASADDPTSCYAWIASSVWYDYTASADGFVRALPSGTGQLPFVAVYTGERGALAQVPGACAEWDNGPSVTFPVTAGQTYHIMLFKQYSGAGQPTTLDISSVPREPNDDFATAAVATLPGTFSGDLTRSTAEPGEAAPSCDPGADQSVWYRYTPDRTRPISVEARSRWSPSVAVYRGDALPALSEVDCKAALDTTKRVVFTATAGQQYWIRVADDAEDASWYDIRLTTAPALTPNANTWPSTPSVFDDVSFSVNAGDRLGRPLVRGELKFGDGTSVQLTSNTSVTHRYAADGDYHLEISATTDDGRSGTGSQTLHVETHDVTLTGLSLPAQARVGQTKPVKVSVVNNRYDEKVVVSLRRKAESGYYQEVGTLTQWVPAGGRVDFPFAYTYTAADAAAGQAEFEVTASIDGRYDGDDHAVDNRLTASTAVRAQSGLRAS